MRAPFQIQKHRFFFPAFAIYLAVRAVPEILTGSYLMGFAPRLLCFNSPRVVKRGSGLLALHCRCELGLAVSATTFVRCIAYLIYNWRRSRSDLWAVRLKGWLIRLCKRKRRMYM